MFQDVEPHDWAVGLPFANVPNGDVDAHGYHAVGGLFPENSVGWYRKTFSLDRADSGGRFVIQFDGIFRDSKVWINNCYLGGHFSGYSGSSYDITDFVRFGAPRPKPVDERTLRGVVLIGLASLVAALPPDPSAALITASELLAGAAFLGLYAALDQAMAAQPLRFGERQ